MDDVLFSLFVPTRNRAHTAAILIREVLTFLPGDCELVVQDCGTDGELAPQIADLMSDPRMRYEHTELVPMTENWNRGMKRCRGEYVSIIGDDDAISRRIGRVARWAKANNIEALTWPNLFNARYYWPGASTPERAGTYNMYRYTGAVRKYSSAERLEKAVRVIGHMADEVRGLPCVYHGLVRRSVVERMQRQPGAYFEGMIPDIYAQFFLPTLLHDVWWVDYPVSTFGVSAKSNSGALLSANAGELRTFYAEYGEMDWPILSPIADGTLAYQAILEGLTRGLTSAGRADLLRQLDVARYYAQVIHYGKSARMANLIRYFRASASLDRTPMESAVKLVTTFAHGAATRYFKAKRNPDVEEYEPPELVERFQNVQDVAQLMGRQERALDDLKVNGPWGKGADAHSSAIESQPD